MRTPASFVAALALALAACSPRASTAPTPAEPPATAPAVNLAEAPKNWMLLDPGADKVYGISLLRAERELLSSKRPQRTVVVAVIDNGIDTTHASLRSHLWVNPKEVAGNGKDDDGNGYADDIRGWDFIAGANGKYVDHDTYELTRIAAACSDSLKRAKLPADYQARCSQIASEFLRKRSELEQTMGNIRQIDQLFGQILPILRRELHTDSLSVQRVGALASPNDTVRRARDLFIRLNAQGITPAVVDEAKKAYEGQLEYGYNTSFDPRPIVGDDYPDTLINRYGNPDVKGPGGMHGTHVSGIIASNRQFSPRVSNGGAAVGDCCGIATSVKIMALRAVPDGDERDKDIASAIRYAADNGAQVINMSFGKSYSPYKKLVDAAVKYADAKGVLMVHAAGNEGANGETDPSFPTPVYLDGGRAKNWIEVGASSWKTNEALAASFSNYGSNVDLFAPGEDVMSTIPGGGYEEESGTSMASPVVAGVAALILSYYPTLTAADVKKILLETAIKVPDAVVTRPGSTAEKVKFSELSATGGIVNAYAALQAAERMAGARP